MNTKTYLAVGPDEAAVVVELELLELAEAGAVIIACWNPKPHKRRGERGHSTLRNPTFIIYCVCMYILFITKKSICGWYVHVLALPNASSSGLLRSTRSTTCGHRKDTLLIIFWGRNAPMGDKLTDALV